MFPYAPPDADAWTRFLKDALDGLAPPPAPLEPSRPSASG